MVKCSECGFLAVRRRMLAHAFPGLMEVTAKQRATWDFGPYEQHDYSPREHLEEMKVEELRGFNRNMSIFLAIVAIGSLAVGIAAIIISLNQ